MKLFLICSKDFYDRIPKIKEELEKAGHEITLPNSYEDPFQEERIKRTSPEEHKKWKGDQIRLQERKVKENEGVLVLNLDKRGISNYIGGSTFLEIYEAWKANKYIFMYHKIPKGMLEDELLAFDPIILNRDLTKINRRMFKRYNDLD